MQERRPHWSPDLTAPSRCSEQRGGNDPVVVRFVLDEAGDGGCSFRRRRGRSMNIDPVEVWCAVDAAMASHRADKERTRRGELGLREGRLWG